MPISAITLRPGVNAEYTPALNEAGISSSSFVRFRAQLAEKYGGWDKFYAFPIGSPIRELHAWQDLNGNDRLAVGADSSLSVITSGVNDTITPQLTTTNPTVAFTTLLGSPTVEITDASITPSVNNVVFVATQVSVGGLIIYGMYPTVAVTGTHSFTITAASNATSAVTGGGAVATFTTTSSSSQVVVTLANHGLSVGDMYSILVSTSVGGLTLYGQYTVRTVPTSGTFTITAPNTATSATTVSENSGLARLTYYITVSPVASGSGYGVGGYGSGGYSTGTLAPTNTGTPITTTDWSLDNWGEYLVAAPLNGAVYVWQPGSGYRTASVIPQAPLLNAGIFVAMPARQIVAYGSSFDGAQDPLLVRWCDVDDFTVWTAASTNQAGSYRIPTGSRIVGGFQGPQQGLLWTDLDLWAMQYIGSDLVYGFNKIMTGCGLYAPHAMGQIGNSVFWMGPGSFYVLSGGGPQSLPCSVWDAVFQNIDTAHSDKIRCAVNSQFDEVAWFFPSLQGGTGVNDSCVKYNVSEKSWDYTIGNFGRTAWIDQSVLGSAIGAAGSTGTIYQHEQGYDADGTPITAWVETGYFALSEGLYQMFLDLFWPDFKWGLYSGSQDAALQVTVYTVNYPSDTPVAHGPFTVTQATEFVNLRGRGRFAKIRVESSDLGSFWRIGKPRFRVAQDGRR